MLLGERREHRSERVQADAAPADLPANPLHRRGDPLVGGGDGDLLFLGDGLQLGDAGAEGRDAGEVVANVAVEIQSELRPVETAQHIVLERFLAGLVVVLVSVEVQRLEPGADGLHCRGRSILRARTQATAPRTRAATRRSPRYSGVSGTLVLAGSPPAQWPPAPASGESVESWAPQRRHQGQQVEAPARAGHGERQPAALPGHVLNDQAGRGDGCQ